MDEATDRPRINAGGIPGDSPLPELDRDVEPEPQPADILATSTCAVETPPSRLHLVFALVAGFALIALPLLIWMRPDFVPKNHKVAASVPTSLEAVGALLDPIIEDSVDEPPAQSENLKLGEVWIDKCEKPGRGKTPPEQCDRQPWFEQALTRAIRENAACAPERSGTLSVVMRVDYSRRKLDVFAGKSGTIRGRTAEGTITCVQRSVPDPPWSSLEHEHTRYIVAVMATYSGKD